MERAGPRGMATQRNQPSRSTFCLWPGQTRGNPIHHCVHSAIVGRNGPLAWPLSDLSHNLFSQVPVPLGIDLGDIGLAVPQDDLCGLESEALTDPGCE